MSLSESFASSRCPIFRAISVGFLYVEVWGGLNELLDIIVGISGDSVGGSTWLFSSVCGLMCSVVWVSLCCGFA